MTLPPWHEEHYGDGTPLPNLPEMYKEIAELYHMWRNLG